VHARGRIKTSQKKIRRNNLIMVSTRKSPQKKTRPTGVLISAFNAYQSDDMACLMIISLDKT
jgi:hypothetical protein